ncbi:MAG TPA: EAL domain-containing protein [Bryobacteraceae bacterium]|jgi:diguanylate cyclase (GGDEF)-like protein|nr:EAL domain-containing protein [Bryobacteraceae bacterium]
MTPRTLSRSTSGEAAAGDDPAEQDAVDLLYRYGVGGLAISAMTSSSLAFVAFRQSHNRLVIGWWLSISVVLALRAIDVLRFGKPGSGLGVSDPIVRNAKLGLWRFGAGVIATGILWGLFAGLFLKNLDDIGRSATAVVLCGMVGGSITVLSPSRGLAIVYNALLVLPASILFVTFPGPQYTLFGVVGCGFFVVMANSSRISHKATMTALRLSRINERLLHDMAEERGRTEAANDELKIAQAELEESNRFLEFRIKARTADLEREMLEKESYAERLALLASRDPLTGLYNRATFADYLAKAISSAETTGMSLAVLFLDLDKFKEVNDVMGHIAGDQVLKTIATRLVTHFQDVKIARWGGDEFLIVMEEIDSTDSSFQLGHALRDCVAEAFEIEHRMLAIDATVGIALYPQHARTQEELIWAADVAMFAGKADKQSRIRLFDSTLSANLVHRHQLEQALREAVAGNTFSLVFQPVIDTRRKRCDAMETLVRWHHPKLGTISPAEFIPIAERTGEIVEIGRWVLHEACREAASWPGRDPPAVSVNISAAQIEAGTLVADVLNALEGAKLRPDRLHLELTESLFATDQSGAVSVLAELRKKGIHVLLDDFGTGFSCLAYLQRLPVDRIKVDQTFVNGIHVDAGPIVESILTTARAFGLEVVAEGVETAEQAETLTAMGAHYLQGHLISGALTPRATREWLVAQERDRDGHHRTLAAAHE